MTKKTKRHEQATAKKDMLEAQAKAMVLDEKLREARNGLKDYKLFRQRVTRACLRAQRVALTSFLREMKRKKQGNAFLLWMAIHSSQTQKV